MSFSQTLERKPPNRPVVFLELSWSGMHRTVPARRQSCQSSSDTAWSYYNPKSSRGQVMYRLR